MTMMKPFLKEDQGSFTFEATLVFPAFLIFVLAGVFFCIIIFQMGTAHYVAQKAASEVAYTWDNSNKEVGTGDFAKNEYVGLENGDGLYWRILDNDVLDLFNLHGFKGQSAKTIEKLGFGKAKYEGAITLDLEYNNNLVYSEVAAEAESALYIPAFLKKIIGGGKVTATSSHVVTESPELIRTFNFAKYLWSEFGVNGSVSDAISSIKKFFGGG